MIITDKNAIEYNLKIETTSFIQLIKNLNKKNNNRIVIYTQVNKIIIE